MKEADFEINRDAVERYFRMGQTGMFLLILSMLGSPVILARIVNEGDYFAFIYVGIIPTLVYYFTFAGWLCSRQAKNLRYRLDGNVLRAEGGVFFLFRKSIPLERITDVALVQGPLLRFFGIWAMRIQTAGSAQCEATLYGVCEPEKVRELILSQRQGIYGNK